MNFFLFFSRLFQISAIALKCGIWNAECNPFLPFKQNPRLTRGARIRKALEALGPIFVKFGQMLSTRHDIFPPDMIEELSRLQDKVPPFASDIAQNKIERALKSPLSQLFDSFELEPLASASIAQVHAAVLREGEAVVVKVLRPHIRAQLQKDIRFLEMLASLIERVSKKARALKLRALVQEFKKTLLEEIDLMREAANASQLRRNFENSSLLYVPKIEWRYTTETVLTQERIQGLPLTDIPTLKALGFNLRQLAENLIEIFFIQVFRDSFFHADMHPGNIFVSSLHPHDPQYQLVDFGIMGILSVEDQRYLAENLFAFFNRDYQKVAELHVESGWVPSQVRIDEFEGALRAVSEPILERMNAAISFGELLLKLFKVAEQFKIDIQPQLILLQKTLMNVESLSRQLDPTLDIVQTAKPHLEKWMKRQMSVKPFLKQLKAEAPYWLPRLQTLFPLIYTTLKQSATPSFSSRAPLPASRASFRNLWVGVLLGCALSTMVFYMVRRYIG